MGGEKLFYVSALIVVSDKNGYSIAATGEANKQVTAYVREVRNCADEIFPDAENMKIVVEGSQKSVVIGEKGEFLVGVQVTKDMF